MAEFPYSAPAPLSDLHDTSSFDCGTTALNEFLQKYALANQSGGSARTYVVTGPSMKVVGFYSIAVTSILPENAPERVRKGQPKHAIPGILFARFAVDKSAQGRGLGKALFRDAMLRACNVANEVGVRFFMVDAKNDKAINFYSGYDAMPQEGDPYRLFWLMKDIVKLTERSL